MPEISIVIVNYNTLEPLQRCLESIRNHHGSLELEIIVVDNGSSDGSAEMVRQQAPEATLIEPGYNSWFSGGNNIGFKVATGDYVLILNADTVLQFNTLQVMLDYLRSHEKVGAVTCPQNSLDGNRLYTCSRAPHYADLLVAYTFLGKLFPFWHKRRWAEMWYVGWQRDSTRAIEVAPGSCILTMRRIIQQTTGFDEAFKLYFTDDELCRRILDAGYEIHFVADTFIVHEEQASTKQVRRLASQIYFNDLLTYSRKFYGLLPTWMLQLLLMPTRWTMAFRQWRASIALAQLPML
jgi:GT2 family glycosyltransferase